MIVNDLVITKEHLSLVATLSFPEEATLEKVAIFRDMLFEKLNDAKGVDATVDFAEMRFYDENYIDICHQVSYEIFGVVDPEKIDATEICRLISEIGECKNMPKVR